MKSSIFSPKIEDFLEIIDPDKTINRDILTVNLGAVVMGRAIDEMKSIFTEAQNKEIDQIIKLKNTDMPNKVLIYLKTIGRIDEFIKLVNRFTIEVKKDYIKTHLKALTEKKRGEVFEKFPALKTLFE